eukprot:15318017-Alexandrium_andersonii.AAC.1
MAHDGAQAQSVCGCFGTVTRAPAQPACCCGSTSRARQICCRGGTNGVRQGTGQQTIRGRCLLRLLAG